MHEESKSVEHRSGFTWNSYFLLFILLVHLLPANQFFVRAASAQPPIPDTTDQAVKGRQYSENESISRIITVSVETTGQLNPDGKPISKLIFIEDDKEILTLDLTQTGQTREELEAWKSEHFSGIENYFPEGLNYSSLHFDTAGRSCSTYTIFLSMGMGGSELTGNFVPEQIDQYFSTFYEEVSDYRYTPSNSGSQHVLEDRENAAEQTTQYVADQLNQVVQPGDVIRMYRSYLRNDKSEESFYHIHTAQITDRKDEDGNWLLENSEAGEYVYDAPITDVGLERADKLVLLRPNPDLVIKFQQD